jgi:hypothetical protein
LQINNEIRYIIVLMKTRKNLFVQGVLAVGILICSAGQAKAELLNIDFGRLNIFGAPSNTYGAASGQTGSWNEITANGLTSNLVGLDGGATDVSLSLSSGEPNGYNSPPSPMPTEGTALMNDYFYSNGGGSWSVNLSNLNNGVYDIYLYAPANDLVDTGPFSLNGTFYSSFPGNADPETFVRGVDYDIFRTTISNGTLSLQASNLPTFGGLAGMQVVEAVATPEPATWAMMGLGLCSLVWIGRKRKIGQEEL